MHRTRPDRRRFLAGSTAIGAGALLASPLFREVEAAIASEDGPPVTRGDIDILRFLAAAELVEDDLWQQYCELAVGNRGYRRALRRIDRSLIRYVCDDRDDERSHAALINAFLVSLGEDPVSLDDFRTLPGVAVEGADGGTLRVTNLTRLTVDTSWFNRYRGRGNPDFGDVFPQLVDIVGRPTVPTDDAMDRHELQLVAHSAAFHFAAIEQGGGSLYASLLTRVTNPVVLRILAAIGPTEIYHFAAFHKSLEGLFRLRERARAHGTPLVFPDLRRDRALSEAIFPEPCTFLDPAFPPCSVIRPTASANAGAVAAARGLLDSGLFDGQPEDFVETVGALAAAADGAVRGA